MKISSTAKYALGVTAAAAMLAGCSSGASSLAPGTPSTGVAQNVRGSLNTLATLGHAVSVHPDTSPSRMDPDAKKAKSLLYISDSGTDDVQVYTYSSKPKMSGTLSGFNEPQGECSDTSGNVFITNTGDSNILEYKSGGKSPSQTLTDSGQYPVGCSVDPKTGDLAVSNIISTSGGAGSVSIYTKAKGNPKMYTDSSFERVYFLAYDNKGTLWLDGESSGSAFEFASFSKNKFKACALNQSITFPGGVFFDGKYVTVGDQEGAVVYQTDACKVKGSTPLTGSGDIVQYFIDGKTLIGPDATNADVELYNYPKGGNATDTLTGFSEPIGSAVTGTSKKK